MGENTLAIFTICSNNYIAMAKVLIDSAAQYHPDAQIFLVLADTKVDEDSFYPNNCTIIMAEELNIRHFRSFAFRYDVMEFNTAVKPWMFLHLLSLGFNRVLYFDPDIEIFCRLNSVLNPLATGASFVLTPHICRPAEGDAYPGDIGVMRAGVYNLGFLGVGAGREAEDILGWWARRLEYQCVNDQSNGIFVDQKFMDLVPGFATGTRVVRDPSLNVAYWNLHQRNLVQADGSWQVEGRALGFFHFSGFDPYAMTRLSKHTAAFRVEAIDPALGALMNHYADRLIGYRHGSMPSGLYAYGRFRSGTAVTTFVRRLFREDQIFWCDDPFDSFEAYLNAPATRAWAGPNGGAVTNLMEAVKARIPELALTIDSRLPDHTDAFVQWWFDHGGTVVGDNRFIEVVAQRIGDATKPRRSAPARLWPEEPEVNVVGYLQLALGVGEAGRLNLRSLRTSGFEVKGLATRLNTLAPAIPFDTDADLVNVARAPIQIFNVNADQIAHVIQDFGKRLRPDAYRIIAPFWELPKLPEPWIDAFANVDEVWAPTRFIQTTVMRALGDKPVIRMPLPLDFVPPPPVARATFGLPEGRFLFFFSFDYLSYIERKNPEAALDAFIRAFSGRLGAPPAALVIKTLNARLVPDKARHLRDRLAQQPDVVVIDQTLSRDESLGLVGACDAVVSLHRSEGLGLLVSEAMVLGKPVVATDFSATTELVTPDTGFAVDFRLIPVESGHYPFNEGQQWADPDIDHAAWLMRRVADGGSGVARRVAAARRHIQDTYGQEAVSRRQRRRLRMIAAQG